MRISNEELWQIAQQSKSGMALQERPFSGDATVFRGESVVSALESPDMKTINDALADVPDTREQIIASLKERIEAGTYQVSGEQIAEMMVRRALADRLR